MSRAFVRNSDEDPQSLRERPVSPHPNFVTARGLAAIEAPVRELETQRQAARSRRCAAAGAPRARPSLLGCAGRRRPRGRAVGEPVTLQGGEAEIVSIEL